LAVIHPWNAGGINKNGIEFISASKIVPMIAKQDFKFSGYAGEKAVKFPVKKGMTLNYLRYNAEGTFEIEISGRQYTADQDLFDHVDDTSLADSAADQWVLMTCTNGNRAYIYFDDLVNVAGIADVGPGVTEYGKARDLTPAEARDLASQR
jgi:hypothetical protein